MFPKNNRDLSNVRLLAQLSSLLLNNSKGLVAEHTQSPPLHSEITLAVGVYGDGYKGRGRPNVNMKFAWIDQTGVCSRTHQIVEIYHTVHQC